MTYLYLFIYMVNIMPINLIQVKSNLIKILCLSTALCSTQAFASDETVRSGGESPGSKSTYHEVVDLSTIGMTESQK